ncbi:hypothetical protein [Sulfurovum sp.]|uniref:hypothetical protein n=1 Tax=Sulfurovum sp. TaxID=1969726 RepID=UPI0025FB26CE|nr:hypothetical protein [Sulfurovum sp.]
MTTEEMMRFKKNYLEKLSENSRKVILTPYEARRKDAWAENLFGSSEYSFMFSVLVHNVDNAKENGYEVAK